MRLLEGLGSFVAALYIFYAVLMIAAIVAIGLFLALRALMGLL